MKPPQKPKRWPTCKHKVEKKQQQKHTTKSQQTTVCNKWMDDYSQSHKSKSSYANDKQMESQTNLN